MMSERLQIFVAVKGHAFSRDAFEAMLLAIGVEPTMVDQPAAAAMMNPAAMRPYAAILLYDMPGMDFRAPISERPGAVEPSAAFKQGYRALLEEGKGIVALHHAIAGWPAWSDYGEALGGRFLYKPAQVRGTERSESGYVGDVRYTARIADNAHPVLAGMPTRFSLTDELYRQEILDDPTTIPLLYLDDEPEHRRFQSAMRAVRRMTDKEGTVWTPPPLNPLLGWVKAAGNAPLVYLQPGDSATTYEDENYRRLLDNALRWVASPQGGTWAQKKSRGAGENV